MCLSLIIMKNRWPCLFIFLFFLVTGLFEAPTFGISWDENDQRVLGDITQQYVNGSSNDLLSSANREYGAAFELTLSYLTTLFHKTDIKEIYIFRHQVTHILFLLSSVAICFIARRLSRSTLIASATMFIYLLSPRIYGHSFYNTKDIPFLCFLAITLAVAQLAFDKNKLPYYMLLGLAAGYTTSIRIMGVMLFGFVCVMFLLDIVTRKTEKQQRASTLVNMLLFCFIYTLATYAFWPYIWHNPVEKFTHAYATMAHYKWH